MVGPMPLHKLQSSQLDFGRTAVQDKHVNVQCSYEELDITLQCLMRPSPPPSSHQPPPLPSLSNTILRKLCQPPLTGALPLVTDRWVSSAC